MNPAPQASVFVLADAEIAGVLEMLVKEGKISEDDKQKAQMAFVTTGTKAVDWLMQQGKASVEDLVIARAKYFNIPYVRLTELAVSPVSLGYVDKTIAERLQVLPFDYKPVTGELYVAMANPMDLSAIEFLEKKAGVKIKPFAAIPSEVRENLETRYAQSLSTEVTAALKEAGGEQPVEVKTVNIRKVGELIKEAPIAKIVTTILEFAIKSRASDVHIEPLEERTRVRYRIDGILHEKLILPRKIHDALVSRIKILSDMKIDEKRIPQDGRFNFQTDTEEVDLRVSCLPTAHGEKVVMRLLKKTGAVPTLQELGLRGRALKNLEEAVLRPHGIILVTGPTGSGKTTTLYSVLSRINTTKVNIVTLEDPVEYQMPGVNQVQINPQAGLTFASGLRSFLRQDPNIIMVGEIRDEETAELAVQASLTGHLVFSTLHTNSSAGALPRLLDMKAEPYLLASTITAIVGQRVARKVCASCKKAYEPAPEVVADIKTILGRLWAPDPNKKVELYKGEGCDQCGNTGYKGRIGIFEVLPVTEKIGRLILEHAAASEIEKVAVDEGMIVMKQDGYLKVVEGVTCIDEVLRVAQE
jgi:type IV pilus assembly protein PilB